MKIKPYLFPLIFICFVFTLQPLFSQEIESSFTIPDFFVSESSATIKGVFDGNTENTFVLFEKDDNMFEASIIKETANEITVLIPEGLGIYNLTIQEAGNNTFIECPARIAQLELSIGKTNLLNGEKTELEIVLSGIENYLKPIEVIVKNNSPNTVALPNGTPEVIIFENSEGQGSMAKNIQITGIKRGTFNIGVEVKPDDKLVSYDWEKLNERWEKKLKAIIEETGNENNESKTTETKKEENYPTTRTSGKRRSKENTDTPEDSTSCNCKIRRSINHVKGNTIYTLTKAMEDKKLAESFRKAGIKFPKENDKKFKGQNVPIVPGSAYATGYGDIVVGYANAIATSWGKKPKKGTFAPENFNTENIEARASVQGTHIVTVTPAPGEWSFVIGVVAASATTQANAIDPVEFDRKLMKEFDRGKGEVGAVATIFGIIVSPISNIVEDIANAVLEVTGGNKLRKSWATTNTDVNAVAEVNYLVSVNEHKDKIHKYSRGFRKAKIVRHSSSKKLEKFKEGKIIVSNHHPTQVSAIIKGTARVRCKAIGNGFSESGVASKTAVCIVGFCVNEDGAFKFKPLFDSGMLVPNKNGKEMAEAETTKIEEKIYDYLDKLEKQLNGKSASSIKQVIENNVEDDIIRILKKWQ